MNKACAKCGNTKKSKFCRYYNKVDTEHKFYPLKSYKEELYLSLKGVRQCFFCDKYFMNYINHEYVWCDDCK